MKKYVQQLIDLFARGEYTPGITRQVQQWLADDTHEDEKQQALRSLWEQAAEQEMSGDLKKSMKRMKKNTGMSANSSSYTIGMWAWRVAAVVLLAVSSVSLYLLNEQAGRSENLLERYVPTAALQQLTLPDGTKVMLNSHSMLLYPKEFTGKTRSVYLVGEADFKVKPDKKHPFIVKACDMQVTALGTEFNVNAYPESSELLTTLLEGSVKVEFNELSDEVILVPGQQLAYNKQTKQHSLQQPEIDDVTAWQRGELVFGNMTLGEIFTELERKYPYTFIYSENSLGDKTYRFRFPKNASIEDVMTIITQVAGDIKYVVKGNNCYIKK